MSYQCTMVGDLPEFIYMAPRRYFVCVRWVAVVLRWLLPHPCQSLGPVPVHSNAYPTGSRAPALTSTHLDAHP